MCLFYFAIRLISDKNIKKHVNANDKSNNTPTLNFQFNLQSTCNGFWLRKTHWTHPSNQGEKRAHLWSAIRGVFEFGQPLTNLAFEGCSL